MSSQDGRVMVINRPRGKYASNEKLIKILLSWGIPENYTAHIYIKFRKLPNYGEKREQWIRNVLLYCYSQEINLSDNALRLIGRIKND